MGRTVGRGADPGHRSESPLDALGPAAPEGAPLLRPELRAFADHAGRLKQWPVKSRLQRAAALYLVTRFEFAAEYSEKQVNAILEDWHTFRDPARLRRTLVDWGYLDREPDGSRYWRIGPAAE